MNNSKKLSGKNVLITVGAQGIGESITRHFIDNGANVAIHYFSSADTAKQLIDHATSKGQKAVAIGGDLSNGQVTQLTLRERFYIWRPNTMALLPVPPSISMAASITCSLSLIGCD